MNRDEFEFGFDPEEEQEARRPKAGNTGHTFVPAFRQAETEGKRPRRSTAFRREQEEDSYMDLDSDFDEEEEIEFGAGSHRESTGRRTVPEREKAQGTERDEVRIKSAADGQAAEAAVGQSGFLADLPSGGLSF